MIYVKEWIKNITTAIVFIAAIELILPQSSIKKYAKFVLGLLLIIVVINPLINFASQEIELGNIFNEDLSHENHGVIDSEFQDYKNESINSTTAVFTQNIEKICLDQLYRSYPNDEFFVEVQTSYSEEDNIFSINKVSVGINEKGVKKIVKIDDVNIGEAEEVGKNNTIPFEKQKEIKGNLSKLIDIDEETVSVYSM